MRCVNSCRRRVPSGSRDELQIRAESYESDFEKRHRRMPVLDCENRVGGASPVRWVCPPVSFYISIRTTCGTEDERPGSPYRRTFEAPRRDKRKD